jgi:hypothetical protein
VLRDGNGAVERGAIRYRVRYVDQWSTTQIRRRRLTCPLKFMRPDHAGLAFRF